MNHWGLKLPGWEVGLLVVDASGGGDYKHKTIMTMAIATNII